MHVIWDFIYSHMLSGVQLFLNTHMFLGAVLVSGTLGSAGESMRNRTGMDSTSIFLSGMFLYNSFQRWSLGQHIRYQPHPVTWWKCKSWGPTPDLLNLDTIGLGQSVTSPPGDLGTLSHLGTAALTEKRMLPPPYTQPKVGWGGVSLQKFSVS